MKRLLLYFFGLFIATQTTAQTYNPFYGTVANTTSASNILNDLTTFENFGVKELGTTALTNTQNWIVSRYQSLGYTDVVLQPFTFNNHTTNNIIITKTGTVYPNTYLIIDAHYDTINGPGTNDNGTGTVILLELARLLKDVDTEYSIKFIHFSGEEDGLIGSNYYVNNTVIPQNLDIRLVFNIDEVGGDSNLTNNTIVCERDLSNPISNNAASDSATTILANCMTLYSNLQTVISNAYASDYMPFENNGEIITGLYERHESPVNHSINDNLAHMDATYVYEVAKGALGAAMEFSVAYDSTLGNAEVQTMQTLITLYPNPTKKVLNVSFQTEVESPVDFRLIDLQGKEIIHKTLTHQNEVIKVDTLNKGNYLVVFKIGNHRLIKKVILN